MIVSLQDTLAVVGAVSTLFTSIATVTTALYNFFPKATWLSNAAKVSGTIGVDVQRVVNSLPKASRKS